MMPTISTATASDKKESTEQPRPLSYVPKAERDGCHSLHRVLPKTTDGKHERLSRMVILSREEGAQLGAIPFMGARAVRAVGSQETQRLRGHFARGVQLMVADWKDARDESAVVNAYLLKANLSPKPEIYLGTILKDWPLALRINGRCLEVPKADFSTAELYGLMAINPDVLLSIRYLLRSDSAAQSFLFIPIGNVFRMGGWSPNLDTMREYNIHKDPWSQNLDKAGFREVNWRVTESVLVLRIFETGVPGGLYLINDRELWNPTEDSEGYEPIGLTPDSQRRTLVEVTIIDHRDLRPYDGTTEKQVVGLKVLSVEKLEIVQSGVKGEWDKGVPPVGLHLIDRTLEGG